MSISDFESRLQEQIKNLVTAHLSSFEQEISSLQQAVEQAVKSNFGRVLETASQGLNNLAEDSSLTGIAREIAGALKGQAEAAKTSTSLSMLKAAINEIEAKKTQAEVLSALVSQSSIFSPRVALFIVKSGNAVGWMARGFNGEHGNEAIRRMAISLQSDTILRTVLSKQITFAGEPGAHSENHLLFNRFSNGAPSRMAGIPLMVRSKAAAVLYADSSTMDGDSINLEALEILVNIAGLTIELISIRPKVAEAAREGASLSQSSAGQPSPQVAEAKPTVPPTVSKPEAPPRPVAVPPKPLHEPAIPVEAPTPAPIPVTAAYQNLLTSEPTPGMPTLPPLVQPTPPTFEAKAEPSPAIFKGPIEPPEPMPAPGFFGLPSSPPSMPPQPEPHLSPPTWEAPTEAPAPKPAPVLMPAPTPANEEEQKLHNDARRFARLLVSEIKLYNEQKVVDGRKNNDLYDRLKEDIDRSRQMYDKRVSALVAAKFDYFYDELVHTLAEGDVAKLGRGCPGPSLQVS